MEMDLTYHDDNQFRAFVDEDFSNFSIVSKKEKKKRTAQALSQIDSVWAIDENRKNDCDYLTMRLTTLQNTIKSEIDKNPSKVYRERNINPLYDWETRYKNAIAENKCEEKKIKSERQEERVTTEEALKRVSDATSMDETPTSTNKYILYGLGALILVVVGIKLLK